MLACVETEQLKVTPDNLARRKFSVQIINAVLYEETGELMEMGYLIKSPNYCEFWGKSNGNKLGRLEQGIPGRVEVTNTIIFINREDIPRAQ